VEYNNDTYETTTGFSRFDDLSNGDGFVSQLTVIDSYDDDNYTPVPLSAAQPSVTCTYDSDDDSASFDLISHMISNDESSINSDAITENQSTAEYLTSAANRITRKCLERNRKLCPSILCGSIPSASTPACSNRKLCSTVSQELAPLTSIPGTSDRLHKMRNRLRSLEVQYTDQKHAPFIKSTTLSIPKDTSTVVIDSLICNEPHLSRSHTKFDIASLTGTIIESAAEIITINLILCLLYLIFVLYKDAFTKIMQISDV